ncbi:unnamed protein product [Chironomus riparius]|uniref:CRAL-TRIO domain-containing protein n=1 Tax=Chironomus riparius TaxID=315576 RepID=A0A9N9WT24_9DIPT|nr:unnamed protein product [Chironomus riparius]
MDQTEVRQAIKVILDKGYNYEDVISRMSFGQEEINQMKERLEKVSVVPIVQDKLCLQFLYGCNGNIDEAVNRIEKYYQIKTTSPDLFWNRDPESEDLQLSFKVAQMAALPITPNNYFVFIYRTVDIDSKKFNFDSVFKTFMMMAENAMITNGPQDGAIFISDWKVSSFGHIFRPRISSIKKALDYIQNASPLKTRAVHILNASHLFQTLFSIIKPFMKKELSDVIHIHTPDLDYNEFFEKYVPRHCMPSDYGGSLQSFDELYSKNVETLMSMKEYFSLEELHCKSRLEKTSL